ncbi:uroporphyrinogen decarboxylase family protein [Aggregatilinea lenta]|uniref:uroporphyrinogen decarboxylase family protein n=1 Tax=Aggregatilinea lenta TaxID=913108 RepID=UPI000E5C3222|nr:uroporphyrinogen decarboxylase family protein [Aggregatilinea lenta]
MSMTSSDRLAARLRGESVDRAPNFSLVMQFAADQIHAPLRQYYLDYNVLCEANLVTAERFGLDIVDAISDPYREAHDFGAVIEFPDDGLPVNTVHRLADTSALSSLPHPDPLAPGSRMRDRVDAVRLFHERVGGQIPVQGWIEGALAEAADLRGVSALMYDLYDRPEWVEELLERATEVAIDFALAQIEAGATIIGLGDAIASQVAPRAYRQFAVPYEQRIFQAITDAGALGRLHICGNTTKIVADMAQSGAQIIDLDWQVDLATARQQVDAVNPAIVLCGNFDPVAVLYEGTPDTIRQAVRACRAVGGATWLCAPGCEIPRHTPDANVHAITEALAASA